MVPFSLLTAVKKDTIFGTARKIFGPSYFMTTLEDFENYHRSIIFSQIVANYFVL